MLWSRRSPMRLLKVVICAALLSLTAAMALSQTSPTKAELEAQIADLVKRTDPAKVGAKEKRELNLLKHQLLSVLDASIQQLNADVSKASPAGKPFLQQGLNQLKAESDSLLDSFEGWNPGTAPVPSSAEQPQSTPSKENASASGNATLAQRGTAGNPMRVDSDSGDKPPANPGNGGPPLAAQSPTPTPAPASTVYTRATAGVEMAAADRASPQAKFFVDFELAAPMFFWRRCANTVQADPSRTKTRKKNGETGDDTPKPRTDCSVSAQLSNPLLSRFWVYFNPRVTSIQQSNLALGSVASVNSTVFQNATNADIAKLVQSFESEQGVEFQLRARGPIMADSIGPITPQSSGSALGLYAFASFGVGVPLVSQSAPSTIYLANPALNQRYGAPSTSQFIDVIENTIDRFYRNYYFGLRLKTFSYGVNNCSDSKGNCLQTKNEFPGVFDVAWGQDEAVNGQQLHGGVVRMQSFYPLPFYKPVSLFAGVNLSLVRKTFTDNAQYVLAASNITPTSPGVFEAGVNPPARDQFRFGIAIDLMQLIKKPTPSPSSGPADQQSKNDPTKTGTAPNNK